MLPTYKEGDYVDAVTDLLDANIFAQAAEQHVKISPLPATMELEIPRGEDKWLSNTCEVSNAKDAKFVLLEDESSKYIKISLEKFEETADGQHLFIYCIQISPYAPMRIYPLTANLEVDKWDNTKESITIEHNIKIVERDIDEVEDLDFHVRCIEYYNTEIYKKMLAEKLESIFGYLSKAQPILDRINKAEDIDDINVSDLNEVNRLERQADEFFPEMDELYLVKRGICNSHLLWFTKSPNPEVRKKALESIEKIKAQE